MTPTSPKDASKLEDAIEKWTVPIGNLFVSVVGTEPLQL